MNCLELCGMLGNVCKLGEYKMLISKGQAADGQLGMASASSHIWITQ
jgi:hypothetical protein